MTWFTVLVFNYKYDVFNEKYVHGSLDGWDGWMEWMDGWDGWVNGWMDTEMI